MASVLAKNDVRTFGKEADCGSRGGRLQSRMIEGRREDAESEEREEREERGRSGNCLAGYYSAFRCEVKTDIDHVIRDHAQAHPTLYALSAFVA
jgi:hypothetical protein